MDSKIRFTGPLAPGRFRVSATHLSLALMVSVASGCYRPYLSPDFGSYQERHRTIALLPFHVVDAGNDGNDDLQPTVYQTLLYSELLEGQQKGGYTVQVQDVEETNLLLQESLLQMEDVLRLQNGGVVRGTIVEQIPGESLKIQAPDGEVLAYTEDGIAGIAKEPAGKGREQAGAVVDSSGMAQILGVDAVLRGKVTLPRPINFLADLAEAMVEGALGGSPTTAKYARVHMTITDGGSGELLWEFKRKRQISVWRSPGVAAKELVSSAAGSFPYGRSR